jgi:hypothetical protein
MTGSGKVPFDALIRIRAGQDRLRDELELALSLEWQGLGNLAPEERQRAAQQNINRLLGAYASKVFDLEAREYGALKLEPPEFILCLNELAIQVRVHMIPPQFRVNSFFYFQDLHYDAAYRSHILSAVEDRVIFWKKGRVRKRGGLGSPRAILDSYREREKLTIEQFAKKARVDPSVIFALKAGNKRKCGAEALARIAGLVGCEPRQLLPEE